MSSSTSVMCCSYSSGRLIVMVSEVAKKVVTMLQYRTGKTGTCRAGLEALPAAQLGPCHWSMPRSSIV